LGAGKASCASAKIGDDLSAYVKSSPPAEGTGEVLMPGEREFRTRAARLQEGIPVDDTTWDAICGHAARLGVDWPSLIASGGHPRPGSDRGSSG
jgi:LDH2 family malate/lactate/ureidoglycolate dehydrogenase